MVKKLKGGKRMSTTRRDDSAEHQMTTTRECKTEVEIPSNFGV